MDMAALEVASRDMNTTTTHSDVGSLHSRLDTSRTSASSGYDFADVSADASHLSGDDSLHAFGTTISDEKALQIAERVAAGSPSRRQRRCSPRSSNKKSKQDLKACMLSMKGQVAFLHEMMKRIAAAERESVFMDTRHDSTGDLSGMSFSSLSPVRKASADLIVLPDAHFKKQMLFQDDWELDEHDEPVAQRSNSSSSAESATERIAELERENAALREQIAHSEQHTSEAVAELLDEIENLKRKLQTSEEAQAHLQLAAQYFEQPCRDEEPDDGADSSTSTASCSIHIDNNQIEHKVTESVGEKDAGEDAVRPEEPVNPVLVNHERCQEKTHELWQTIKNLKVYVETYRIEMDDLKVQRDEAVASADRAWKDNAKLAGNTNPQQKIKYLQAVKNENAVLSKKIRELQSRLAAQRAKKAVQRVNSVVEPQDSQSDLNRLSFDESVLTLIECQDGDDESEPERRKLFQKMWHHNKELEAEIVRLRQQKKALDAQRSRSESTESNSSAQSSSCSNNSKKLSVVATRRQQHSPSVA